MTLPMSFIAGRAGLGDRGIDRGLHRAGIHLLRQEALDHGDLGFLLRGELGAVALAVQLDALARDFTMPRSIAAIAAGPVDGGPGRAAMSISFSFAVIMRMVEMRGASPARIDALISSVKRSRRRRMGGVSFGPAI